MRTIEAAGKPSACTTEGAHVVLELALGVVLQEPVEAGGDHPDRFGFVDEDADGVGNIGPFLDELTFLGEHLNAVVAAVADVNAVIAVDGYTVHEIELSRSVTQFPELHEKFAVGVVAHDA